MKDDNLQDELVRLLKEANNDAKVLNELMMAHFSDLGWSEEKSLTALAFSGLLFQVLTANRHILPIHDDTFPEILRATANGIQLVIEKFNKNNENR